MLDLSSSLYIATSGLKANEYALGVASQNIANAGTSGYVAQTANVRALDVAGSGSGVQSGPTTLAHNLALTTAVQTQNATVASWSVQSDALSTITALQGSVDASAGSTATLSDSLGNVQTALISLTSTPSSASAQQAVVTDAQNVVSTVHTLASAYQQQRQTAQNGIVNSVQTINNDLTTIGSLSEQIMALRAQGTSAADLESQRDTVVSQLSSQISIRTQSAPNGDMIVSTTSGLTLPTHNVNSAVSGGVSDNWPLTTANATITAATAYPGTDSSNALPGIYLSGRDITSQLTSGILGANITLRDVTLPTMQAQLDSFSSALVTRFQAQGLSLFAGTNSNDAGASSITGLSQDLSVSAAYTDGPSQLVGGSAVDVTSVNAMLGNGFAGSQTSAQSTNLGVNGNLSTGYDGTAGLISLATTLTAQQASVADAASNSLTSSQSAQTALASKLSDATGVSVDSEMSTVVALQNAYTANAKVVAAVQTMFNALLSAIGG